MQCCDTGVDITLASVVMDALHGLFFWLGDGVLIEPCWRVDSSMVAGQMAFWTRDSSKLDVGWQNVDSVVIFNGLQSERFSRLHQSWKHDDRVFGLDALFWLVGNL